MSKIFRLSFGFVIIFVTFITFSGGKVYATQAGFTNICNSPTGAPTPVAAACPAGGGACFIQNTGSCCITSSNNSSYCTSGIYGKVRRCVCTTGDSYLSRCDSCGTDAFGHSGTVYMNAGCDQTVQLDVLVDSTATSSFLTYYGGSCIDAEIGKLTGNIYLTSNPSDHHPTVYPGCTYNITAEGHSGTDPGFDLTDIQVFYKTPTTSYGSHSTSSDDSCPAGTCWARRNLADLYSCDDTCVYPPYTCDSNNSYIKKNWTAPTTLGTYQFALDVADHCSEPGCNSCTDCCKHSRQEWCAGTTMTAYSDPNANQIPMDLFDEFDDKCYSGSPSGSDYIYPGYYRLDVDVVEPPHSDWSVCLNGLQTRTVTTCSGTTTETQACECTGTNIDRNWVTPAVGPSNGAPAIPLKTTGVPEPRIANYSTSPASVTWVPSLAEGASSPAKVNGATYAVGTSFAVDLAAADSDPSTYGVDTLTVATTPPATLACPPKNICVVQRPFAPNAAKPISYWNMDEAAGLGFAPPYSYWKLNENPLGTTLDSLGRLSGTNTGTTVVTPGKLGTAARSFNGTSDRIVMSANAYDSLTTGTIEAWVKPGAITSKRGIFAYSDSASGNYRFLMALDYMPSTTIPVLQIYIKNTATVLNILTTTAKPFLADVWHHVAFTSSPTGNVVYIDGVALNPSTEISYNTGNLGTPAFLDDVATGTNNVPTIGVENTSSAFSSYFPGTIDDVRIYNYVRTQSQIQADMAAEDTSMVVGDSLGTYPGTNPGTAFLATPVVAVGQTNHVNARSFNGASSYVSLPGNGSLNITGDITVSAWVKTNVGAANQRIVSHWGDTNAEQQYLLQLTSANMPGFHLDTGSGTQCDAMGTTAIPAGSWHHLTGVKSGTNCYVYVDGVQAGMDTDAPLVGPSVTNPVRIGHEGDGTSTAYFNGLIDDVRVYNYALSGAQITSDINSTSVGTARLSGNNAIFSWQTGANKGCTRETVGSEEYCTACSYDYMVEWDNQSRVGGGTYIYHSGTDADPWIHPTTWSNETTTYTTPTPVCGTVYWRVRRGTGYVSGAVGVENWSPEYSFDTGITCSYPPTATINFSSETRKVKVFAPNMPINLTAIGNVLGGAVNSVTISGSPVGTNTFPTTPPLYTTTTSCGGLSCTLSPAPYTIATQGNYYFKVDASNNATPTAQTCNGSPYCNTSLRRSDGTVQPVTCYADASCVSCSGTYDCADASKDDYVMAVVCPMSTCGNPTLGTVIGASTEKKTSSFKSSLGGEVLSGSAGSQTCSNVVTSGVTCDILSATPSTLSASIPWPSDYATCMSGFVKLQVKKTGDWNDSLTADQNFLTANTWELNYDRLSSASTDLKLRNSITPAISLSAGSYNFPFSDVTSLPGFGSVTQGTLYYWRVVRYLRAPDPLQDADGYISVASNTKAFINMGSVMISGNIYTDANLACQAVTGSPSIAYWKLDDGTIGQTSIAAVDSVGSNTGTATGTTVVAGKSPQFGNARSFNGNSDYISINSVNPFLNNFTVEAWVNFSAVNKGSDNAILGHGTTDPPYTQYNGLHLAERSGKAYFGFYFDDLSGDSSDTTFTANRWYHLAFVYDGGKKIYVDGSLETSGTSVPYQSSLMNAEIGRYPWLPTSKMSGIIDDVKIYNYARTSAQVLEDYHGPMGGTLLTDPTIVTIGVASTPEFSSGSYSLPVSWSNEAVDVSAATTTGYTSTTCNIVPNATQTLNLGLVLNTASWIQVSNGDVYAGDYGDMEILSTQSLLTATTINTCGVAVSGKISPITPAPTPRVPDPPILACPDRHVESTLSTGSSPKNYLTELAAACPSLTGCPLKISGTTIATIYSATGVETGIDATKIYVSGGDVSFANVFTSGGLLVGGSLALPNGAIKATINPAIYLADLSTLPMVGISHTSWKELN